MNRTRMLWVLALAALATPQALRAQSTGTVVGRVTDQLTGAPIAGAQVFIAGTTRGTLTGQTGQFTISGLAAGNYELRATLIGFTQASRTIAVTAAQTTTVDLTLRPSAVELGAVVVTASGEARRTRELGNSVSHIQTEEVSKGVVNSLTNLLNSRAPGVSIQETSGTTGTSARIRIRGSNSVSLSNDPLVVVDGVRVNVSNTDLLSTGGQYAARLDDFSPEQIESVEILKGPAASAMYGTAAANGVIQITTKRGKAGSTRWTFYTEQASLKDVTDYPANVRAPRNMNGSGPGKSCVIYDLAMGNCTAITGYTTFNALESSFSSPFQTGHRGQYGMSVSGGDNATTFYVAGDYDDENGVLKESNLTGWNPNVSRRLNLRTNLNARSGEKLDFSIRGGYNSTHLQLPVNDNHLLGIFLNALDGTGDSTIQNGLWNNVTMPHILANEREQDVRRLTGSVQANFRPLSWLTITGTSGVDQVTRHDADYYPSNLLTTYTTTYKEGFRDSYRIETTNVTTTLNASARHSFRPDLLSTTSVGAQHTRENYHDTRAGGQGMVPGVKSLQGATKLFSARENTVENATVGGFVQEQLAYRDRLYFTAAVRGDDNSAFGSDIGFVTYPSFSASWVASDEAFFPKLQAVSSLRLRSAWGKSGLRPSFRDAITTYDPISVRIENAEVTGFTVGGTGDAKLRPEIAREFEIGFDAGFMNDRLALEVTRYDKQSKDALVRRVLPPSLGLASTAFANIGSVSNKGWEAALRGVVVERSNVRWDFTLSGSTNKNRLEKLAADIPNIIIATGRNRQEHREGYPLGGYWYRSVTWKDVNNDGLLQYNRLGACAGNYTPKEGCEVAIADSLTYQGNPFPERDVSLNTSLTVFKYFTVAALLNHKGGFKQRNHMRFDRCSWEQVCEETYILDKTSVRDQAGWIAYNILEPNVNVMPYLEDGDFVKLREVSLSIEAPQSFVSKYAMGARSLRLTLSGRNLKTWTDYRGLDPELNQYGLSNFQTQEYFTQPPVRYYTARVDLNF